MSQPTILVINEDDDIAEIIADILEFHGEYHAVTTYNGATGIALAVSEQPKLIIVNNMMPNPNGYEVCRVMHAKPLTSKMPIIMTMGTEMSFHVEHGLAAGADGFLQLPLLTSCHDW